MGEAKRKRLAIATDPCLCGSRRPAGECCLSDGKWHKAASIVDLSNTGKIGSHAKCYLRELNSCSSKITGEHFISHAALRVLAEEKIDVSGFPWMKHGESRIMTFGSLTTNRLCSVHNHALSPLDAVAGQFFQAIKDCGTTVVGPGKRYLFSGHDIERWLLKTLAGLAASKNLANNRERIASGFVDSVNVPAMLESPALWTRPVGLYFGGHMGQVIQRRDLFHFAPLSTFDTNKIAGITTLLQGFDFTMFAAVPPIETPLDKALHRPGGLVFNYERVKHVIELSWNDDIEHFKVVLAEDV